VKILGWLLFAACAAVIASALRDGEADSETVEIRGARHGHYCLIARYPQETLDHGFPWCTCSWRDEVSRG